MTVSVCLKELPEPEVNAANIRTVTKMLFSETTLNAAESEDELTDTCSLLLGSDGAALLQKM
jgi:hypothetical protein